MNTSLTRSKVEQLRRDAKRLKQREQIKQHEALDRVAVEQGYRNWSLLEKRCSDQSDATVFTDRRMSDDRHRYYIHGDQYEGGPTRYFCRQCDAFLGIEHFAAHGPHTGERYLDSLERWKRPDCPLRQNTRRPDGAVNLFAKSAPAARAEYMELRDEFGAWLRPQKSDRSNVGLLARFAMTRPALPRRPLSLLQLAQTLRGKSSGYVTLNMVESAWEAFKEARASLRPSRPAAPPSSDPQS